MIAAALIMMAVFSGLSLGVLLDAFVVRMLLVPAIMHLIGRGAWWLPRWLDRIIPNVDVEGAALERRHPVHHGQRDCARGESATGAAAEGP